MKCHLRYVIFFKFQFFYILVQNWLNFMNVKQKIEETKFVSAKKWHQSGRDYNFRGNYKFRAHCIYAAISNRKRKPRQFSLMCLAFAHHANESLSVCLQRNKRKLTVWKRTKQTSPSIVVSLHVRSPPGTRPSPFNPCQVQDSAWAVLTLCKTLLLQFLPHTRSCMCNPVKVQDSAHANLARYRTQHIQSPPGTV